MQAREADPRFSTQPTSPRLGRSDSKKKLGIFVKRTYAGLTSSFRKDLPSGDDSEFDQQREEFEQLLRKVARLHKRVVRYNKTFSDMGSEMVELAQVLQSFGGGPEGNRFGEDFMQAASSMQQASASFSSGVAQIDQDLKAFYGQLKQYSKQVELRDAALADLGKATRKVQKAKKRPEAIKSQQAEAHYEEIKQVYVFLNDEVKQQLQAYNSQRMLYIMPHLEKLSACHLDFLQQAMSGAAHLHQHRAHIDDPATRKGLEESAGRPALYRSMTEGANILTRSNQRPLYARRQSNPELREVEPLIYRGVDTDSEDENENDDRDDDQKKVESAENEAVVADEDDEPSGVAPFEALTSPRHLHAPTSETASLRSRAFSAPEARQDETHTKPKKKKKTVVLLKKKKKEDKKAKSKSKNKKANISGNSTKAEDQQQQPHNQHEDSMLKKRPSLDAGKEKQSKTESPDESEVRRASADETHAQQPSEPSLERRPSFRRPAHVHPPARPTPPTPSPAGPADNPQASDASTPSYSTTASLTSSFSSSSSSSSASASSSS